MTPKGGPRNGPPRPTTHTVRSENPNLHHHHHHRASLPLSLFPPAVAPALLRDRALASPAARARVLCRGIEVRHERAEHPPPSVPANQTPHSLAQGLRFHVPPWSPHTSTHRRARTPPHPARRSSCVDAWLAGVAGWLARAPHPHRNISCLPHSALAAQRAAVTQDGQKRACPRLRRSNRVTTALSGRSPDLPPGGRRRCGKTRGGLAEFHEPSQIRPFQKHDSRRRRRLPYLAREPSQIEPLQQLDWPRRRRPPGLAGEPHRIKPFQQPDWARRCRPPRVAGEPHQTRPFPERYRPRRRRPPGLAGEPHRIKPFQQPDWARRCRPPRVAGEPHQTRPFPERYRPRRRRPPGLAGEPSQIEPFRQHDWLRRRRPPGLAGGPHHIRPFQQQDWPRRRRPLGLAGEPHQI